MSTPLLAELDRIAAVVRSSMDAAGTLPDDELLAAVGALERASRGIDSARSVAAAEVARRSSPDRGYSGLAVRLGHRTADRLIANLTGSGRAEALKRVRVGTALATQEFAAVDVAVRSGRIGIDQADAITRTLVTVAAAPGLTDGVATLIEHAAGSDADSVASRARLLADELAGPTALDRESALRSQRFLRVGPEIDGMRRLSAMLDPESSAVIVAALDAATSPRRGGPRFVDPQARAHAAAVVADERTDDHLRLDALVDLVRVASAVGHAPVLGAVRPAVRVVISSRDLESVNGSASIEGVEHRVSAQTARRMACESGLLPVVLGGRGEVLDLGRTARAFSSAQRVALAVRDAGCRWPGCDRPPSWCEAHHIREWSRGGGSNLDNAVLLCRHHHMLVHNNHWRIEADGAQLRAIPPPGPEARGGALPMPSKRRVVIQA